MNTGIGDAVNLAWKLASVLRSNAADILLDTYEPERIAFAQQLVATTDRGFTLATTRGFGARFVRTRLVPLLVPLLFRLSPVRRFVFQTLSQIGVNYRNSPLSVGAAGAVRGGDRLPWVEMEPGQDNFAPLTSLKWQVHVYGEVRSAPPLRVAAGNGASRSQARGTLSHPARRLRRAGRSTRRP
jgi:FAD binding domain